MYALSLCCSVLPSVCSFMVQPKLGPDLSSFLLCYLGALNCRRRTISPLSVFAVNGFLDLFYLNVWAFSTPIMDILWILWSIPAVIAVEGKLLLASRPLDAHPSTGLSLRQSACINARLLILIDTCRSRRFKKTRSMFLIVPKCCLQTPLRDGWVVMGPNYTCSRSTRQPITFNNLNSLIKLPALCDTFTYIR